MLVFVLVAIVFFAWLQGPALVAEFHVHTRSMLPQDLFPSCRKVRLGLCRLERGEQCFVAMLAFPHFSPSDVCRFPQFPKEHFLILRGCLRVSLGQSAEAQVFVQQTMKTASSDEELAFKQKEKDAQM